MRSLHDIVAYGDAIAPFDVMPLSPPAAALARVAGQFVSHGFDTIGAVKQRRRAANAMQTTVMVALGLLAAIVEPGFSQTGSVRMTSVPVSPSVVATVASRGGQLVLLVLWRGSPRWHSSGSRMSARGGGDQSGMITATLEYGDTRPDLSFDPATSTVAIQGRTATVSAGTNVLLVDGVDTPGGVKLTKTLSIDPAGVDLDPRLGLSGLVPVLGRSQEIVDFLQCDAVPDNPRSVEPCQSFKKR